MKQKAILSLSVLLAGGGASAFALTSQEQLGKSIFFDQNLSIDNNQSCASCHAPEAGWTGPDPVLNAAGAVYKGSVAGRFGNRKPPSSAYATPNPVLHYVVEEKEALFIGGNFWDGRATGQRLGNPAAEQALGPFLNPLEQALPDAAEVVTRICAGTYSGLFAQVCGADACSSTDAADESGAYDCVGLALAAYEGSPEVNQYSSKFDAYLAGKGDLTPEEKEGLSLFKSQGKCANCHVLEPGPNGEPPLFTDFTYDNLGIPRNKDNPFYKALDFNPQGPSWIDLGLGAFLASRVDYERHAPANNGKMKVPTLRNLDKWDSALGPKVKAYGHNGYFKSLWQIVHFYNTRDVKPRCADAYTPLEDALAQGCWPVPQVPINVNTEELGNLQLRNGSIITWTCLLAESISIH